MRDSRGSRGDGPEVEIERFIFLDDGYVDGVHSLGAWFLGRPVGGTLALGTDPELDMKQILADVRFVAPTEFVNLGTVYPEPAWWQRLWLSLRAGFTDHRSYTIGGLDAKRRKDFIRERWI